MSRRLLIPIGGGSGGGFNPDDYYTKEETDELLQGVQSIQGLQGADGLQGIQGIAGQDGTNGVDGQQGIQGIAGQNGTNGADGHQGIQGIKGIDGTNGVDGFQGIQGLQGEKGESIQGTAGTNGVDGFQGIQGLQGPAGGGGGSTRYAIATKSQAELADFYQNWQTIMASNDVYVDSYPVTSVIPDYTVQGYTALLLEYNIGFALEAGAITQTPVVKGGVGAYYILPNGMGGYYGANVTMPSKDYVDAVANTKQDTLTAGEGISIQGTTISATGGGGSAWYGTQAQFEALQNPSADVDYFISDQIKWDEIKGRPDIDSLATKSELNKEVIALDELVGKKENKIQYMSMQGFQSIQPQEGYVYAIEGSTVEMVFTFTDSTQATYNVVID